MDVQAFVDAIRDEWQAAEPVFVSNNQMKYYWKSGTVKLVKHWHWSIVYSRTFLELLPQRQRAICLGKLKSIHGPNMETAEFGSLPWIEMLFLVVVDILPIGDLNTYENGEFVFDFWVGLGPVPNDVYKRYKDKEIPIFSERANRELARYRDVENRWTKTFIAFYKKFQGQVFDIYLIVSPKNPTLPQYRLKKSLAIAPDQRVFLAEDIRTKTPRVVKWEQGMDSGLASWDYARKSGVDTLDFDTSYAISKGHPVLVMELLQKINGSDDMRKMLVDVLSQLQSLHRAGIVHADLKLDNIMKRPGEVIKYFIIDYDSISRKPFKGIDNALFRRTYSPVWTSQIRGGNDNPTSYRYDLEELFYAVVELGKLKRFYEGAPVDIRFPDYLDSETLWKNGFTRDQIIRSTHQSKIPGERELSKLWLMIMNLPERLPFAEIDHTRLIQFVLSTSKQNPSMKSAHVCSVCTSATFNPTHLRDEEGQTVAVCGLRCAGVANPETHGQKALEFHQANRKLRSDAPPSINELQTRDITHMLDAHLIAGPRFSRMMLLQPDAFESKFKLLIVEGSLNGMRDILFASETLTCRGKNFRGYLDHAIPRTNLGFLLMDRKTEDVLAFAILKKREDIPVAVLSLICGKSGNGVTYFGLILHGMVAEYLLRIGVREIVLSASSPRNASYYEYLGYRQAYVDKYQRIIAQTEDGFTMVLEDIPNSNLMKIFPEKLKKTLANMPLKGQLRDSSPWQSISRFFKFELTSNKETSLREFSFAFRGGKEVNQKTFERLNWIARFRLNKEDSLTWYAFAGAKEHPEGWIEIFPLGEWTLDIGDNEFSPDLIPVAILMLLRALKKRGFKNAFCVESDNSDLLIRTGFTVVDPPANLIVPTSKDLYAISLDADLKALTMQAIEHSNQIVEHYTTSETTIDDFVEH